ncbi:MAG TPA: FxsA family protein [Planctomycetota bacterium]|nr:FxsA family protein [Planctomycetota bacterium]
MRWILLIVLLFIGLPILELYLLYKLAGATSVLVAVGLLITTGVLGGIAAKWQGVATVHRLAWNLRRGQSPTNAILDGVMILVGGVLLITPGIITDFVGLCLLVPPIRRPLRRYVKKRFLGRLYAIGDRPAPPAEYVEYEVKKDDTD